MSKNCIFVTWFWPRQWNTRVQSAPRPRAGPTVTWAMRGNCSPQVSAQVFWTLEALKDPVFLLRPSWWHSTEEATQGALSSSLKKENQGCDTRPESRAFLSKHPDPDPRKLYGYVDMIPREYERGVDLWVVFLCILKPLSGGSAAKSQVPAEPRKCNSMDAHVETTPPVL